MSRYYEQEYTIQYREMHKIISVILAARFSIYYTKR